MASYASAKGRAFCHAKRRASFISSVTPTRAQTSKQCASTVSGEIERWQVVHSLCSAEPPLPHCYYFMHFAASFIETTYCYIARRRVIGSRCIPLRIEPNIHDCTLEFAGKKNKTKQNAKRLNPSHHHQSRLPLGCI